MLAQQEKGHTLSGTIRLFTSGSNVLFGVFLQLDWSIVYVPQNSSIITVNSVILITLIVMQSLQSSFRIFSSPQKFPRACLQSKLLPAPGKPRSAFCLSVSLFQTFHIYIYNHGLGRSFGSGVPSMNISLLAQMYIKILHIFTFHSARASKNVGRSTVRHHCGLQWRFSFSRVLQKSRRAFGTIGIRTTCSSAH